MNQPPCITVIHGPLLDQLGTREPDVYGAISFAQLNDRLMSWAQAHHVHLAIHQAGDEARCVAVLRHAIDESCQAVVLNPAGLTHTSVVLRDTVAMSPVPILEVHLSNIAAREPFRAHSLISPVAAGSIVGLGVIGYEVALEAALRLCERYG